MRLISLVEDRQVIEDILRHLSLWEEKVRLIISDNDRTQEILYTDTWGVGHELKRLGLADAWTITIGLYCLQPRDLHF